MKPKHDSDVSVLEHGDIYFFYRPKVQPQGEPDVIPKSIRSLHRFYMVLHAHEKNKYRLLTIGKKKMPKVSTHEKAWLTVEKPGLQSSHLLTDFLKEEAYETKTQGKRFLPAARPCAEGTYCILKKNKQTYLVYDLEIPKKQHVVQEALNILSQASYVLSVKNQDIAGTQGGTPAKFPKRLIEKFRNLRFAPTDPPDFMNYAGAELLLIGATDYSKSKKDDPLISKNLKPTQYSEDRIFEDLKIWKSEQTIKPLFEGIWK